MGDRYELNLHCAYCNALNFEIWYAPTCGSIGFKCANCKKVNYIKNFQAVKREDVTADDLFNEFMNETNVNWSDDDIERIRKECESKLNEG